MNDGVSSVIPSYQRLTVWNEQAGMYSIYIAPTIFWGYSYNSQPPKDGEINITEAREIDTVKAKFDCYNSAQIQISEALVCGVFTTSPLIVTCGGYVYWNYENTKQSFDIDYEVSKAKCD